VAWLTRRSATRIGATASAAALPLAEIGSSSRRRALVLRIILGSGVLVFLASPTLLESAQGEKAKPDALVEFTAEVRLPAPTRFALIRDAEVDHQSLHKPGEPIFVGADPLPLGKLLRVDENAMVLALTSGHTVQVPKGTQFPGGRGLIFIRGVLLETLRYQIRYGRTAAAPGADYSLVEIRGRQAILQRDALPGEGRTGGVIAVGPGLPPGRMGTAASGGPSSRPKENTLATLVSNIPIHEVAPDTWELPAHDAKEIGNHSSQLLFESLGSATPSVTMRYGIALTVDTSLGNGTLDRRGFLVNHLTLASRLGLDMGDRILFVNDEPVNSLGGLYRIHKKLKSDSQVSEVKLVVNRSNQLRTLTYRLR
jgi:hypothetical protein